MYIHMESWEGADGKRLPFLLVIVVLTKIPSNR